MKLATFGNRATFADRLMIPNEVDHYLKASRTAPEKCGWLVVVPCGNGYTLHWIIAAPFKAAIYDRAIAFVACVPDRTKNDVFTPAPVVRHAGPTVRELLDLFNSKL